MEYEDFAAWIGEVERTFWANGRFWNFDSEFLTFMYQDDATPEEVFELVCEAHGY